MSAVAWRHARVWEIARVASLLRRHGASLAYLALGLAVAGPLLAPGVILTGDLVQVPHPHLASDYWGIVAGTHSGPPSRLPLDLLFVGLGRAGLAAVGEKALLLAIVFLAGRGMHRLVDVRSAAARYFAGVLYAVNPFVYDRLLAGEWYFLLGYALLPHAFGAFRDVLAGARHRVPLFAALAVATGVASPHAFVLLGVLCALLLVAQPGRDALLALGLACAGSVFWLVPTHALTRFLTHVGPAQLHLYRTVADPSWGLGVTVASLYGFWNEFAPIKAFFPAWPLFGLLFATLALCGAIIGRRNRTAWVVLAAGTVGFLLALGDSSPLTRPAFEYLLAHVGVARSFRESQKGVALVAFAYAYLGAWAIDDVRKLFVGRRAGLAMVGVAVLLPAVAAFRLFGGLSGQLSTSHFPASWTEAKSILAREGRGSQTLVLPWDGYLALHFADGRIVRNPATDFFATPMLVSRSIVDGPAALQDTVDPLQQRISGLLAQRGAAGNLATCLASLGVGHVLLARDGRYAQYAFLGRQRGLVVERRWPDLVLYRNLMPASLVMHGARSGACTPLTPLRAHLASPVDIALAAPPPPGPLVVAEPYRRDWHVDGTHVRFASGGLPRRTYALCGFGLLDIAAAAVFLRRRRA